MTNRGKYDLEARVPSRFSLKQLAGCIGVVKCGDAVDPDSARSELARAEVLAVVSAGRDIVGVGAIKRKRLTYANQIAQSSGFSFSQDTQELGYVAVEREHRGQGLSPRIVAELLSHHEGALFATTSDERMKKTLAKAGFLQKGHAWKGRRGQQVSLWIESQDNSPSQG